LLKHAELDDGSSDEDEFEVITEKCQKLLMCLWVFLLSVVWHWWLH